MKRLTIITALLAAFALTGCGTLKKNSKTESETVKTENTTKTVETKTVTEKVTTTVTTQPDTAKASEHIDKLIKGDTLEHETENTSIKVFYDTETGKITAEAVSKPQIIPVDIDRTTVSTTEITETEKTELQKDTKEESKEREPAFADVKWTAFWLVILLLILFIFYRVIRNSIP